MPKRLRSPPPRPGGLGRLLTSLRRLAVLAALAVIAVAALLLAAERSGWLARKLQVELSARLGDETSSRARAWSVSVRPLESRGLHLRDAPELLRVDSVAGRFQ